MRIAIVDDERPARSELRHQIQELLKEAEIVEGDSGAASYGKCLTAQISVYPNPEKECIL